MSGPDQYGDGVLGFTERAAAIEADIPLETYWSDRTAALAEELDRHWLAQRGDSGFAYCTCGDWKFDAGSGRHPLPRLGAKFLPFSEHVAKDALLYLREHGWTLEREG